jgi:ribonuclease P protein component
VKLTTLKHRSEFLRLRGGARCPLPPFVLETKPRPEPGDAHGGPRFGFTVTKAIGNAVVRNRVRRRLKAAVTAIAVTSAKPGFDYVLIARSAVIERDFSQLKKDLERAFHRVHQPPDQTPRNEKTRKSS